MAKEPSVVDPTRDQLGVERARREVIAAKEPLSQEEVPGVRGPPNSTAQPESVSEDDGKDDAETWGSEGGAGTYAGGPVVSDINVPPERASIWARITA